MPKIIRPLRDNILVRQDAPKEQLKSGLFLPSGSRDLHDDVGTVIATGPGITVEGGVVIPLSVKPGDRVAFKRRPASALGDIDPEWKDMLMLKDEDIIGVLDGDSEITSGAV